jgi:RNA polymerase sigma-70 factor, ECF subfamily
MNSLNEEDLLKKARAFDMQALTDIYDLFNPAIFAYSQRLLGSVSLAEECVAETFSRLLHALKNGRGPKENLRAYLYRIAHNWITDYYRQHHPEQPGEEEMECFEDGSEISFEAESNLSRQIIRQALLKLPEKQQQIILLRYIEGWEHTEIAASLGKSVNYIKVNQHRAVRTLRRELAEKER